MAHPAPVPNTSKRVLPVLGLLVLAVGAFAWLRRGSANSDGSGAVEVGPSGGFENFLLITVDTTRADHLGCYGFSRAVTPNMDEMARRGVLFENCIAVAPITLPSHASILTGLYPFNHGARNNSTHYVPEEISTVAEVLSEREFSTGAVVSAIVLDSRHGLDQGFDVYDDDLSLGKQDQSFMFRETTAEVTAERATRWLGERGGERWFLWVHFFDPHKEYRPPEPFGSRSASPYDGEIAYMDHAIGLIFDALRERGELDRTLVALTGDHGEGLGEHGEETHSIFIYDSTTRVPFLLMHPALAEKRRVEEVVSSVDIVPTALDLLGIHGIEGLDGRSLAEVALDVGAGLSRRAAYSESMSPAYNHGWSDLRAVRDQRGRYIRAPRPELYDLTRDPRELDNLYPRLPQDADPYIDELADFLSEPELDVQSGSITSLSKEERSALAALGYVWTGDDDLDAPGDQRKDPKDGFVHFEESNQAKMLLQEERFAESAQKLRTILAADPGALDVRGALAAALLGLEEEEEALELLRETVSFPVAPINVVLRLARLERWLELEEYKQTIELGKSRYPFAPEPWTLEGDYAADDGESDMAKLCYEKALELDDRCAPALVGLGGWYSGAGRWQEAEPLLLRATEVDSELIAGWFNLGVARERLKKKDLARAHYEKALELEPTHVTSLVNLASLYMGDNRIPEAGELLVRAEGEDAEDYLVQFNLGRYHLRVAQGSPPDRRAPHLRTAREVFETALSIESDHVEPWKQLMVIQRMLGNMQGAYEAALRVLGFDPLDLGANLMVCSTAQALGDTEVSDRHLETALGIDAARVEQMAASDANVGVALERLRGR